MCRNNKLGVFCLFSRFLGQESSWSADQVTGVYIFRRKRVSVLMTLINATQGVVSPGKGFLWGISFRKMGLGYFLGGGGNILKIYRNNKIWCFTACFVVFWTKKVFGPRTK